VVVSLMFSFNLRPCWGVGSVSEEAISLVLAGSVAQISCWCFQAPFLLVLVAEDLKAKPWFPAQGERRERTNVCWVLHKCQAWDKACELFYIILFLMFQGRLILQKRKLR
jgi:hypothetical protein